MYPLSQADKEMVVYLRENYGDEIAARFQVGAQTIPPRQQRTLMHLALVLHRLFPGHDHINFPDALAFFGLPSIDQLGSPGSIRQKVRAAHLIVHMARFGEIPLDCPEWLADVPLPSIRPSMVPIDDAFPQEA